MRGEQERRARTHPSGGAPRPGSADVAEERSVSRRWALIAVAVLCLGLLAAGISVALLTSPGAPANRPVAGATSIPQATTSATPQAKKLAPPSHSSTGRRVAAPARAVAAHGLAKSAIRYPKRLRRQILRWEAGPGGKALAAVTAQMGYAMQAAGTKIYPVMRLTCTRLLSEIKTARAAPAIPDPAMRQVYRRALAGLSRAAVSCQHAIWVTGDGEDTGYHVHNTLLNLAWAEFAAGSKVLYNATADIRMP
jgi:hypothetical protein